MAVARAAAHHQRRHQGSAPQGENRDGYQPSTRPPPPSTGHRTALPTLGVAAQHVTPGEGAADPVDRRIRATTQAETFATLASNHVKVVPDESLRAAFSKCLLGLTKCPPADVAPPPYPLMARGLRGMGAELPGTFFRTGEGADAAVLPRSNRAGATPTRGGLATPAGAVVARPRDGPRPPARAAARLGANSRACAEPKGTIGSAGSSRESRTREAPGVTLRAPGIVRLSTCARTSSGGVGGGVARRGGDRDAAPGGGFGSRERGGDDAGRTIGGGRRHRRRV